MPLVSVAYIGLLALVAATPVLLFFDNLVVDGAIQLCAAIGMAIIAVGIRPGEARHFFKLIRVPAALGAIPLLWMLSQLLPIPIGGISRSIWDSAAGALNTPLSASISIDPGLTLIALCRFASMLGIAFVAAAVSIERQRAEKLLLVLASAAAVIALAILARQVGGFDAPNKFGSSGAPATVVTVGIIGIILFAACAIMIIERYTIRGNRHEFQSQLLIPITIIIVGLLVCSLTLVAGDTSHAIFAAACGTATVVIIYYVRRIGFGTRAGLAIGCVAMVAVGAIIWTKGDPLSGDLSLRYTIGATADAVSRDNRIIDEVGLGGSGAGTYRAISTVYGTQEPSDDLRPSTFAAQIAIELGRPALWIVVGLACAIFVMCAQGAFTRGRDFFYPLAGAGVTVAIVLNSFSNAGLTNPALSLLVAVTLGLCFAQSVGRSL
jgi:hypothetical protein